MAVLERLQVILEADSTKFTRGLSRVREGLFNMRSLLGGVLGAGGLGAMVTQQLRAADSLQKLSLRLGASTEALSELKFAAKLSGVEFNTMTMGLQRMTRRLGEMAATGKGEAKSALERLGLDAERLAALKPEQQLEVIADALNGVENQSEKVALAFKFFDSAGVSMLQMLEGGSEGLRKMREEARATGLTLSQDAANGAAKTLDAMTRLQGVTGALAQRLTIQLAPALTGIAEFFVKWAPKIAAFFEASIKSLGNYIGGVAAVWGRLLQFDFSGAFNVATSIPGEIKGIFSEAFGRAADSEAQLSEQTDVLKDIRDGLQQPRTAVAG